MNLMAMVINLMEIQRDIFLLNMSQMNEKKIFVDFVCNFCPRNLFIYFQWGKVMHYKKPLFFSRYCVPLQHFLGLSAYFHSNAAPVEGSLSSVTKLVYILHTTTQNTAKKKKGKKGNEWERK